MRPRARHVREPWVDRLAAPGWYGCRVRLVEIARARDTDLERVLEIRYAAFSRHAPSAYSPTEVQTLLADVEETELQEMIARGQLFVARHSQRIVGVAGWKGADLRHVYVDPNCTREGIGSQLLCHVETDYLARTGAHEINAGVVLYAEPFYRANGYELIQRAIAWDGSAYLQMRKRLSNSP